MGLDADTAARHVDQLWDGDILPVLHDYIRIPNVSVAYDAGWHEAGHMARATSAPPVVRAMSPSRCPVPPSRCTSSTAGRRCS